MKHKYKQKLKDIIIFGIIIPMLLWVAISSTIQAFKCPEMSQTELFIHIPKSFVSDWEY